MTLSLLFAGYLLDGGRKRSWGQERQYERQGKGKVKNTKNWCFFNSRTTRGGGGKRKKRNKKKKNFKIFN